ncbi:MAG: hypothetical protein ACUZ8H_05355 [Candidatus Anammoxibacter sp.]
MIINYASCGQGLCADRMRLVLRWIVRENKTGYPRTLEIEKTGFAI